MCWHQSGARDLLQLRWLPDRLPAVAEPPRGSWWPGTAQRRGHARLLVPWRHLPSAFSAHQLQLSPLPCGHAFLLSKLEAQQLYPGTWQLRQQSWAEGPAA